MKAATREWIKKAEADFLAALALKRLRKTPLRDQACFHFQQAAEKLVKACLEEFDIRFPRTHQIEDLIKLALPFQPTWSALLGPAAQLSDFAVHIRYPGREASAAELKTAHQHAKLICQSARQALAL
jgi:HEPN domain-containing protein